VDSDVFGESSMVVYYRITQVDYSGKSSQSKTVSVSSYTTVKEQPEIWPNPTKDKVYIKLPTEDPGILYTITITTMNGVVVFKQKSYYQTLTELDVKDFQPGIYLTTIQVDDEVPVNKKLIIE
jgi:hypothetical protein